MCLPRGTAGGLDSASGLPGTEGLDGPLAEEGQSGRSIYLALQPCRPTPFLVNSGFVSFVRFVSFLVTSVRSLASNFDPISYDQGK
ncbi:hypothetical protein VM1G_11491 [Cytospora mali]|uniref:Uncharacterized protein n=1 Tax=Cytospora mali TaxID=578113 RepID=A0A194VTC8_CYTMA|nr:hypothetical protein VM1G_11491 [Valsa mali]